MDIVTELNRDIDKDMDTNNMLHQHDQAMDIITELNRDIDNDMDTKNTLCQQS